MTDDRSRAALDLFNRALQLPEKERAHFIATASEGDDELLSEALAMLEADSEPSSLLDADPGAFGELVGHAPAPSEAPKQIGPYRILQVLGEGGMGVVYEAEQIRPVRRRVALKMTKVGLDSKEVLGRFETERQALAVMDHPGIAKVFDAGETASGRPYFVMELVRGIPLLEYCSKHRLDTRQRIGLFIDVCEAVQHAHQKGVIHRDLTPRNVLVAGEGDEARTKVIDFGIAKATGQRLADSTVVTTFGQALGTLAYMSPEQAEMSAVDVDTRSDIYSLGVTLHELLLGRVPLNPVEVGAPRFLARLVDPDVSMPTLAERLESLEKADIERIVRYRNTTLSRLRRELSGDLQWIVLKAMDKARTRRYESANGLAADLRRYLAEEPVVAHPPTTRYRLRKFVRRNRLPVTMALVGVVILLGASVSTVLSRNQAVASERAARAEAERAEAVNQFLVELLGSADPAQDGRDVRVVDVLERASQTAEERFGDAAVSEGSVRLALGRTYLGLGLYAEAEQELDRAIDLYRGLDDPGLPIALYWQGIVKTTLGVWDEAEALQVEALDEWRRRDGPGSLGEADALGAIGLGLFYQGDMEGAAAMFRDAVAIYEQLPDVEQRVINGRANLAAAMEGLGDVEGAARVNEQALQDTRSLRGSDHVDVATLSGNLALKLQRLGRMEEAAPLFLDAVRIQRAARGDDSDHLARALNNLGAYYRRVRRLAEAEEALTEALRINTAVYGDEHREVAANLYNLGRILHDQGQPSEAVDLHVRALEINLRVRPDHTSVPRTRAALALAYLDVGRIEDAEALLRQARRDEVAIFGEGHYNVANVDMMLGDVLRRAGRAAEAEERMATALPIVTEALHATHEYVVGAYQRMAALYDELGDDARAERYQRLAAGEDEGSSR